MKLFFRFGGARLTFGRVALLTVAAIFLVACGGSSSADTNDKATGGGKSNGGMTSFEF